MKKLSWLHQWKENIQPILYFMFLGAVFGVGYRAVEFGLGPIKHELTICIVTQDQEVEDCEKFDKRNKN